MHRPSCVVLGAGGFIGTNLCRRLVASGHRVRAFGRHAMFPNALQGAEWFQGDFTDPTVLAAAVEGFDLVFHLVHATTPQSANLDMASDVVKNVPPSLALFDIARKLGVKRMVFVSSGGTIYGAPQHIPTPETAPTDPITAYGVSKLAIEKYLALHERLYGLDYRVLRVTNPFGPFQVAQKNQGLIAALMMRTLNNESMEIWGDGSVVRDFIFVDDVMDALEAAARDQSAHRIFNIGCGEGHSLREVINAVETIAGRRIKIRWKPGRPVDVPTSVAAIDRAREALGWSPRTPFENGLRLTLDWWKSINHSSPVSHAAG